MDCSGNNSGSFDKNGGWFCYMLQSMDGSKTYVGATVNPNRRLRQHNGEISGGARATKGRSWRRAFLIGGFASERPALRFEWRWKWLTRQAPGDTWLERRTHALSLMLAEHPDAVVLEGGDC
jgi:predicted GIY-YIG superfamily endonuclease